MKDLARTTTSYVSHVAGVLFAVSFMASCAETADRAGADADTSSDAEKEPSGSALDDAGADGSIRDAELTPGELPPGDSGSTARPDSGMNPPDSGASPRDSGANLPDSGANPRDSGVKPPDSGANPPDSGANPPDSGASSAGYATTFSVDENPISESGRWSAIASPWLRVQTVAGVAKPNAFVTGYNDNYASLSGFGPDLEITATVYIAGSAPFGEILLLARMAQTATTLRGYEFLYDGDGSVQLMRWNGAFGDFTPLGGESANPGPLHDNDQLRLRIVGTTLSIFHRRAPGGWVKIGETSDGTFRDGQPGFGFFVRDEGQSIANIGLRDYAVVELP